MRPVPGAEGGGLAGVLRRAPAYARLVSALARDPAVPPGRRALLLLAGGYSVSPVDAIPAFVPVLGQLDDLLVLLAGIRAALGGLPEAARRAHLERVGLTAPVLEADYAAVRAALARGLRRGAAAGARLVARTGRWALGTGFRAAVGTARLLGRWAVQRARPQAGRQK